DFTLPPDTNSTDRQWFRFAVTDRAGQEVTFRMAETDKSNVPEHWEHARPVFSRDGGRTWPHVARPLTHADNVFTFQHTFETDREEVAFHFPYTFDDAMAQVERWSSNPIVTRRTLGKSVEGRPIEHLLINDPNGAKARRGVWVL